MPSNLHRIYLLFLILDKLFVILASSMQRLLYKYPCLSMLSGTSPGEEGEREGGHERGSTFGICVRISHALKRKD